MIGREEHEGRATDGREATPKQKRNLRRLLGRYVRRFEAPEDGDVSEAFARPLDAVAYALARHMLSDRGRLTGSKSGAHDWIETLSKPEDAGQGSLRILDLARRRGQTYAAWRVAALRPLQLLYGYPAEGWLGSLNAAVSKCYGAQEDDQRERMKRQPWAYRANVVDRCIRLPEDDRDEGGES